MSYFPPVFILLRHVLTYLVCLKSVIQENNLVCLNAACHMALAFIVD